MSKIKNIKRHFISNKKYYGGIIAAVLIFALGFAAKALIPSKAAMIDVQKVVNSSSSVKALQAEHQSKMDELQTWLKKAQKEIEKEKVFSKKKKLTKKYQEELDQKQQAVQQEYVQKLQKIDVALSEDVTRIANENGYALVFAKGTVFSGADDITELVIEQIR